MENNKVYHSGIKGMKWGVRRYQNADGTLTSAGKKRYNKELEKVHDDYKKAHGKTNVKTMSDKELRDRINRLQMEQQYSRMNPSTIQKGMTVATAVAGAMGTVVSLYNNGDKIVKIGKSIVKNLKK